MGPEATEHEAWALPEPGVYEGKAQLLASWDEPPAEPCPVIRGCGGTGIWHVAREGTQDDVIPDMIETYCRCPAGQRRATREP